MAYSRIYYTITCTSYCCTRVIPLAILTLINLYLYVDKTEDGFKQKFRACRPESGETLTNPNLRGSHKNDRNGEDKGFKAKLRYQEMLQMWGSRSYKYKLIRVSNMTFESP
jgi:hypothetical protein